MKKKNKSKVNTNKTKSTKSAKKKSKSTKANEQRFKYLYIIVALFFSAFVCLSNFDMCGSVGQIIKMSGLFLFGSFSYLLPIVFVCGILFTIFDDNSNIKIIAILILYLSTLGYCSLSINNMNYNNGFVDELLIDIDRAKTGFSLNDNFSSGAIIGFINYFFHDALGEAGFKLLYSFLSISAIVFVGGTFIANLINKIIYNVKEKINEHNQRKIEDEKIMLENEKILKNHLEKRKKTFEEIEEERDIKRKKYNKIDNEDIKEYIDKSISDDKNKNFDMNETIDTPKENDYYDTSFIKLSAKDIRQHFFDVQDDIKENKKDEELKKDLLYELKNKSINEILTSNKNIDTSDFYYHTDEGNNIHIDDETKEKIFDTEIKDDTNEEIVKPMENVLSQYETNDDSLEKAYKEVSDKKIDTNMVNNKSKHVYRFPPLSYLQKSFKTKFDDRSYLMQISNKLEETFKQFGVGAKVINVSMGPSITRFELQPDLGVRVKRILDLQDDIKLAIAATEIRIEAPIPGKSAIGIEVPNKEKNNVYLGDVINSNEFRNAKSKLTVAIGKDLTGKIITCDLMKMPHLLVAGATGSGKSVCINSIIMSILYKATPDEVRLILVDPKVVELQIYNSIPHLLIPVVTDPKKAASALNWSVAEMMRRYHLIVEKKFRDIDSYNIYAKDFNKDKEEDKQIEVLPKIVIIIDEFADLMMVASKDVENAIFRIAQLARACGIHLVIATQRPSVNVISGSIKANVPGRIAFSVSSSVDSKTILDQGGAEKLIGHGDMLYYPTGIPKPIRVQGTFVSDEEIKKVVNFVKVDETTYDENIDKQISEDSIDNSTSKENNDHDEYFVEAGKLIISSGTASSGFLQRKLSVGFNRATRILDQLAENGVVGQPDGKKPREILMSIEEFMEKFG